jgi:integrase
VWRDFLVHHGAHLRPTTLANWKQEWRKHIEPELGSWPVGKISVVVVKDYLARLERGGVGSATRAKCRSILHRLLEESVENQEIPSNPANARGTRVPLPQRRKARILTPNEVARVTEAARELFGVSNALAIEAMFFLGLRIGEMAGLQAADVDIRAREIVIARTVVDANGHLLVQDATKTNRYRVLPVPANLPIWLRLADHIRSQGLIGQAPVFPSPDGGVIRPNNWRKRVWAPAMSRAQIEDPPTPHSGRRTSASLLSAANVPPAVVQAILGHSTLQQTGEYVDVPRSEMEAAFGRLAETYGLPADAFQAADDSTLG